MTSDTLQIIGPTFCAALTLDEKRRVVRPTAPILAYMLGWTEDRVLAYVARRGWTVLSVLDP